MKSIYLLIVLLFICCDENKIENNLESIYDFNNNQITGKDNPVNISISDKNKIIYNVKCDSLVNVKEKIYLYDNVDIEIFNNNIKSTQLFSDNAVIKGQIEKNGRNTNYNFSKADMIAEGNVVINSIDKDDQLFTNKIMLFNNNRCNILIDTSQMVTYINNNDTMRGYGFESDCEMNNWKILKPMGTIYN